MPSGTRSLPPKVIPQIGRSRDLPRARLERVAGGHGCNKPSAYILMMSNAIGLILLVCTLYLCRITRRLACRPESYVNKPF